MEVETTEQWQQIVEAARAEHALGDLVSRVGLRLYDDYVDYCEHDSDVVLSLADFAEGLREESYTQAHVVSPGGYSMFYDGACFAFMRRLEAAAQQLGPSRPAAPPTHDLWLEAVGIADQMATGTREIAAALGEVAESKPTGDWQDGGGF